jgi:hypothetical protein
MSIAYSLVETDDFSALTVFVDGQVKAVGPDHPNWNELVSLVADPNADENRVARLLDPAVSVSAFFERLSDRVTVSGGQLYLDGEVVDNGLAQHILDQVNENNDSAQALVNFMEKVVVNPNEHSREQLYDWLSRHNFAINAEGNFLAYKGVRSRSVDDSDDEGKSPGYPYESISQGTAMVDGKVYSGAIPNGVGAVVEMPRGEVQHDPSVGCHTGLHAGTWDYAHSFSQGAVLLVEINPRDVVSVPTDCNWQKIRTCRYKVVEVVENKLDSSYYNRGYDTVGDDVELDEDYSDDYYDDENDDFDW